MMEFTVEEIKAWMMTEYVSYSRRVRMDWLIAEVERLTTAYVDTRTERDHLSAQVGILQSALTHAKAEGRREGMEEAAKIADCYVLGEDAAGKDFLATEVAAAIRQQAVPTISQLPDGEPCGHAGCLQHVTHPCEGCGRIAGRRK